jgi:glutamate N-acetyltransferase/amino-acid N-acetyltransferase
MTADIAAQAAGCRASQVFIASTGVIGEPLDASKFSTVLEACERRAEPKAWLAAAKAIMTTDTFPKVATRTASIGGVEVRINGIAKGAGMIAPDMATMLSFIFTDAPIAAPALQALLKKGADKSFNCVTVDSDTSTSDTLLLFATGAAGQRGAPTITLPSDRRLAPFRQAFEDLLVDLAQQVARDGEGARKFITVRVTGATGASSAKTIAMAIANSPLVKTAVAGEDANWGRVVMAVGKAGEPAERDKLAIWFGDIRVAHKGARDPAYDEAETSAYMKNDEIVIRVDLGLGRAEATAWTCDLTKAYVEINGDYRS